MEKSEIEQKALAEKAEQQMKEIKDDLEFYTGFDYYDNCRNCGMPKKLQSALGDPISKYSAPKVSIGV